MNKKPIITVVNILLIFYSTAAFLYIFFIVQPELYFHHVQPSFLKGYGFISDYMQYPGGMAELSGNLFMQAFAYKIRGAIIFFIFMIVLWLLLRDLLNNISFTKLNALSALIPSTLAIVLANDYKLPFSVIVSLIYLLLMLLLMVRIARSTRSLVILYLAGALSTYWFAGSGYFLLFSVLAIGLLLRYNQKSRYVMLVVISSFGSLFPLVVSRMVYPLSSKNLYFYFYTPRFYFMAYEPSFIFYVFLLSVPALILLYGLRNDFEGAAFFNWNLLSPNYCSVTTFCAILLLAYISHRIVYKPDINRMVACDYDCYHNNPKEVTKAALSLRNYNFAANVNYNLSMSKAGKLTDYFFDFFQISGAISLYPDYEFSPDMTFIATDFYYHLGYISEARHWAYESLVYYPYSQRAMKSLVLIHLVTGEYKAAERYLALLENGFNASNFVRKYKPFVIDTFLITQDEEIMYKRSCIPAGRELSPFIQQRFTELVEANPENKEANEWLLLYHLLEGELEQFAGLYHHHENIHSSSVYEEAILLYGEKKGIPVVDEYDISNGSFKKYKKFKRELQQYNGKQRAAMNEMYREFGNSYLFFYHFIYPRIIKPDYITEYDENQVL